MFGLSSEACPVSAFVFRNQAGVCQFCFACLLWKHACIGITFCTAASSRGLKNDCLHHACLQNRMPALSAYRECCGSVILACMASSVAPQSFQVIYLAAPSSIRFLAIMARSRTPPRRSQQGEASFRNPASSSVQETENNEPRQRSRSPPQRVEWRWCWVNSHGCWWWKWFIHRG